MGSDVFILVQQLDDQLVLAHTLRMAANLRLMVIPTADKYLRNLGTFDFFLIHLVDLEGSHATLSVELIYLVERLQGLQMEVQVVLVLFDLMTTLIFNLSHHLFQYMNQSMGALTPEYLSLPRAMVTFY